MKGSDIVSNMRVSGLASGMDIDSIIEEMMVERNPQSTRINRLQQDRQILEWQQESYREINTALRSFQNAVDDMKLQSLSFLLMKASSSDQSIIGVTANSNAVAGSYEVKVDQLATSVSKGSIRDLGDEEGKTLAQQFKDKGINDTDTITFTLQGSNGIETFNFKADETNIIQVEEAINEADIGIKATYDADINRFFLTTETTGADQKIIVTDDNFNFLSNDSGDGQSILGLELQTNNDTDYKGTDAVFDFNGATGITSASNNVTVQGIVMNLKEVTGDEPVTITVSNDNDAVFDNIVNFVDKYNSLMETISDTLYEKKYTNPAYLPLTDDEKENLTDDEIRDWTEKAQSGLLRNDSIISGIYSDIRMTMSAIVPGVSSGGFEVNGEPVTINNLSVIGIKTTEDYLSAELVLDEKGKDRLRDAIENDLEGVMDLFTMDSETDDYYEMGIADRLYQDVANGMERLKAKAGLGDEISDVDESFIGVEIQNIDERIETLEYRLEQIEDRYYKQFSYMETVISKLDSQGAWLLQQFSTSE